MFYSVRSLQQSVSQQLKSEKSLRLQDVSEKMQSDKDKFENEQQWSVHNSSL